MSCRQRSVVRCDSSWRSELLPTEEMTFTEESSVLWRPSVWSDWRRRYLQTRFLCSWILAAVLPFILLRLVFIAEITFPFQSASSSPVSFPTEAEILHGQSPAPSADVESKTSPDGPPFIRPDEDAWVTHDDWINDDHNPPDDKVKEGHHIIPNGIKNSTEIMERFQPTTGNGENFGLPEDNETEELELESSEMTRKEETRTEEDPTAAEETVTKEINRSEARGPFIVGNALPEEEDKIQDREEEENLLQDSSRANETTPEGQCDLFEGEWEHDPEGPLYTNATCFYIQEAQNCMSNGRPDSEYMYWKWKPRDCDLPRFDAKSFLDSFRGKAIGFIGDSIARNQMQSLLCLLSQVEIPVSTYVSADDQTVRWLFVEHQVILAVVWSSYLLKESNEGVLGFEKGQSVLFLDELDSSWTSAMTDFDIIVFLTGQWYYKSSVYINRGEVVGCHYCPKLNLTEIGFYQAYRKGIREVLEKVSSQFKGVAIMSTFPLAHFENGTWDTGGFCQRELPLELLQSKRFPGDHNRMRDIIVDEFQSVITENRNLKKDARLEILDVTKVSLQRADGHPGPFRRPHPFEGRDPNVYYPNDCLHWCLPGPIEVWNQLLVRIIDKYL